MNRLFVGIVSLLAIAVMAVSCIEEPTISFDDIEQRSLKAWIEKHRPELKDNYQEEGGYYVEVLDAGCADSLAITGKDVWLWYDFTGRDLEGTICETRDWKIAKQLGTYTDYTHYVPSFRFSGKESTTMMEGTYLATFNKLTIGGEEFEVRYGTKLRLYLPSAIVASVGADGGYEGQYGLEESKPLVVDMSIYGHVANPVAYEGSRVEAFANVNGGLCAEHKTVKEETDKNEDAEKSMARRRGVITRADDNGEGSDKEDEEVDTRPLEFFDGRWHQPVDTLEHLLVNYAYSPARQSFDFDAVAADKLMYNREEVSENKYQAGDVYANLSDVDRRINEALVERFGAGITYDEVLEADSVKTKPTVKVWYIGRFVDGFIFDTNIDEVEEIVYGKVESEGEALTFETADPLENDYILAWNYAIPTLRRGQWATILTVSTYAYGLEGQTGATTSTTTNSNQAYYDYANYYNYMNYMNSYYGYGYGNMYNNGYYGYNPYYYGYVPPVSGENTSVTVTTTSTEIQAYTPLIFQVFVEK
jgi:FKBP-type peptidyl-prolyl cis-trans isomerase